MISSKIAQSYSESHRYYHTIQHIEDMLYYMEETRKDTEFKLDYKQDLRVYFAILYHDIVYDPTRDDNEKLSVRRMKKDLKPIMGHYEIDDIGQMILVTKDHKICWEYPDWWKRFLDLDLMVLAAPEKTYKEYANDIRMEYKFIPYSTYAEKRIAVLEGFIGREIIYYDPSIAGFNTYAKENMKNEIEFLKEGNDKIFV